jgi:thioredoxin:protein disulfide reductase
MLKNETTLTLHPKRCNRRSQAFAGMHLILAFAVFLLSIQQAFAFNDPFTEPLDSLNKLKPENVVQFKLIELNTLSSRPSAVIELDTRKGFKVYEKGLEFSYKSDATLNTHVELNFSANPAAKVVQDPFYNEPRGVYEKGVRYNVIADFNLDETGVFRIRFEACSVNTCLLPSYFIVQARPGSTSKREPKSTDSLGLQPSVTTTEAHEAKSNPLTGNPSSDGVLGAQGPQQTVNEAATLSLTDSITLKVQQALGLKSWLLFPALFLAGLLMNLTPCIYPMIPITLNVLGHARFSSEDKSDGEPHPLIPAVVYVAGIILSYALMGVVAGMTGSLFGSLLQSRPINLLLAALMFTLGLTMLGAIDISRIQNLGNKIPLSKQSPRVAVFTMGAVSGLVAAPCTGPVLSLLLVLIGQTKDPAFGFTLMSVFAAGFGAPYLLLGLVSQRLKRLPKAGKLMLLVKNVFAALMFALCLYYLKIFIGNETAFALLYTRPTAAGLAAISVVTVAFFLWQVRKPDKVVAQYGTQIGLTMLALWMTLGTINGFVTQDLPQIGLMTRAEESGAPDAPAPSEQVRGLAWEKNLESAIKTARQQNKGLLIDAWAQWCTACLQMDADVWIDPKVVAYVSQHFVPVKVDFTESNPQSEKLAEEWDLAGLPAVGLYPADSNFKGIPPLLYREAVTTEKLMQGIKKLLNPNERN